ncbi:MAG: hypothetical protein K6G40_03335 [Eubacterium sp.]|nr:hypothetical protein [Eubacterium sp.]
MSRMFGGSSRYSVPKETEAFRVVDTNELAQRKIQEALEHEKLFAQVQEEEFTLDENSESPEFSSLFANPDTAPEYISPDDGFIGEGFDGENEFNEEYEDNAEELQEMASSIIEDAKAEAERILEEARFSAEDIKSQAHEEGYKAGFADGQAALEDQKEELSAQEDQLEQEYKIKEAMMERELVETILQVVDKVFRCNFTDKKALVLQMVSDCLAGIDGARQFNIKVSKKNVQFMSAMISGFAREMGPNISIEVSPDASLDDTQVVIETETGMFDCSPFKEFDNLCKDIRTLAAEEA